MTNETAKKLFEVLLNEIRSNGFTDIGSFMIDEVTKENEFEEFAESYEYIDSETILSKYEQLVFSQQGAMLALNKLLDASIEYFTVTNKIPTRFSETIRELGGRQKNIEISFQTINENKENINTILQNESVNEMLLLLNRIRENVELDDETFFNTIKI
jgi:hypothetical protein